LRTNSRNEQLSNTADKVFWPRYSWLHTVGCGACRSHELAVTFERGHATEKPRAF
jgi:hypothetical protein